MLTIIAALDKNRLIGAQNKIPWRIEEDTLHFRAVTLNHTVVMGDKTYASLGNKPLNKRRNIVLTLDKEFNPGDKDVEVVADYREIVNRYANSPDVVYVIGGGTIYRLLLPYCAELILSFIPGDYIGDVYFPEYEDDFTPYRREERRGFEVVYYKRKG